MGWGIGGVGWVVWVLVGWVVWGGLVCFGWGLLVCCVLGCEVWLRGLSECWLGWFLGVLG